MEMTQRRGPGALKGTRRRIVGIASDLFSERSYLGASMNDIAERLGITKPALYYHFPSKIGLYAEVLDEVFVRLRAVMAEPTSVESPPGQLHRLLKNYLEFGMQEKNLINALVVRLAPDESDLRSRIAAFRQELTDRLQPVVEKTTAAGLPQGTDSAQVAEMLVALMDGLLVEYSFLDKPLDVEKVTDQIVALMGLCNAPGTAAGDVHE